MSAGTIVLFSVVIPTFNRADVLRRALDSVFAQRYRNYEVIVVDDGSTDDTRRYLESLGSCVTALSQPNRGPGAARNLGAQRAEGEYVAFLDSDDLWFPWTLSCFAQLIERYERPAILSARLAEFEQESDLTAIKEAEVRAEAFSDYLASHRCSYFVGGGMSVLRLEKFLACDGYTSEVRNAEDHDLILRLGEAPGFVQVIEPATLGYRRHPGSLTRDSARSVEGALYLIERERSGHYAGGTLRLRERRAIITQRTRPITVELARRGLFREAWTVYRETIMWNFTLGRFKYLGGFVVELLLAKVSVALRRWTRTNEL